MSITSFSYALAHLPTNQATLQQASALLEQYKSGHPNDPSTKEAEAVLALKQLQLQAITKIVQIQQRLLQFEQMLKSNPQEVKKNFDTAKDFIRHHQEEIAAIPSYAFTKEFSKTRMLTLLSNYDVALNRMDPGAWKIDALATATIGLCVIGLFGWYYSWEGAQEGAIAVGIALAFRNTIPVIIAKAPTLFKQASDYAMEAYETGTLFPPSYQATKEDALNTQIHTLNSFSLIPDEIDLPNLPLNKQVAYEALLDGESLSKPLQFSKYELSPDVQPLNELPFEKPAILLQKKTGMFDYPPSTPERAHWTVDFADSKLLNFVDSHLLAQEEKMALEHPALYHLKEVLAKNGQQVLQGNQVALIQNVERYGAIDDLYGTEFSKASPQEVLEQLRKCEKREISNILAMAAPKSPQAGKLYSAEDLETLFIRAYTGFSAAKQRSPNQEVFVHTGNWGAGAFGGSPVAAMLMQILAARLAGVNLAYYPLEQKEAFSLVVQLLQNLEANAGQLTVRQLITLFAEQAPNLGIRWGQGNGT